MFIFIIKHKVKNVKRDYQIKTKIFVLQKDTLQDHTHDTTYQRDWGGGDGRGENVETSESSNRGFSGRISRGVFDGRKSDETRPLNISYKIWKRTS